MKLLKRSSISSLAQLISTGIFTQLISFAFYPLIGRIYSPSEFGVFAFFSSLTVILAVIITGQFHNAIVNPKEDLEAENLASLSFWLTTACSSIILAIGLILYFTGKAGPEWLIFPFYLFLYTVFEIFKMVSVRRKTYGFLNVSQIINRIGSNITKIVRPMAWGSGWLLISEIICFWLSNHFLYIKSKIRIVPLRELQWNLVKKYKSFPIHHSTSLLAQFLISELPSLYFKSKGQNDLLGYYSMGNRLFVQPCMLIGYSLHPILIHHFTENLNVKKLFKVISLLSLLALTAFFVASSIHGQLIEILVGKEWLAGLPIYDVQMYMILSRFFQGTVLALLISKNKSAILLTTRIVELVLMYILTSIFDYDFLVCFVSLEITADLFLVGACFGLARKKG